MTITASKGLRIGEVAELTGTTPRTIRYYEEIGLLPGATRRAQGKHRCYTQADVERVKEIIRLRDLLGLSLEEVSKLSDQHLATQLELVRGRRRQLEQLEAELLRRAGKKPSAT